MKRIVVRELVRKDLTELFKLRHEVFCLENQWVKCDGLERDEYDNGAEYLGLHFDGNLIGSTRIRHFRLHWMIENEFSYLIKQPIVKHEHTAEVSRYFIIKRYREQVELNGYKFFVSKLLQHVFYQYCIFKGYQKIYCVFSKKVFLLNRRLGFPISVISDNYKQASGDTPLLILIDWTQPIQPKFFCEDLVEELVNVQLRPN